MEALEENEVAHEKNLPKKNRKNAKRFSDEQIKTLESSFKLDSKLEPSKKLHIARDLGLQPRQVAIWFQNRRARWKSKQIEQDYKVLKANYDDLYAQSEFLMREKQSLQMQMEPLSYKKMDFEEFCSAAISTYQLEALENWEDIASVAFQNFELEGNRVTSVEELAHEFNLGVTAHSLFKDWIRVSDGKLSFLGYTKFLHGVTIRSSSTRNRQ